MYDRVRVLLLIMAGFNFTGLIVGGVEHTSGEILGMLKDKDWRGRRNAAEALKSVGDIPPETIVEALLETIKSECENPSHREPVGRGFDATGTEVVKAQAAGTIIVVGAMKAVPMLRERLKSATGEFRHRLVFILAHLGESDMYEEIVKAWPMYNDPFLKANAIRALSVMDQARYLNADQKRELIRIAKDAIRNDDYCIAVREIPIGSEGCNDVKRALSVCPVKEEAWSVLQQAGYYGTAIGRDACGVPVPPD